MQPIKQLSVTELKAKQDAGENFCLIDCREPDEYELCKIEGSQLIPLSQFSTLAPKQLAKDQEIVIHCHHGGRSQRACQYLASLGFANVSNLAGGIDAWAVEIDNKVKRY
jgi:rhodanese-related sulfurtransferase